MSSHENLHIFSLEISMARFMMLVRDGLLLIRKENVKAISYLDQYKVLLYPEELDQLENMMKELNLSSDIQNPVPESNKYECVAGPANDASNDYVLAGWNDELFSTEFLESLKANDGWGPHED